MRSARTCVVLIVAAALAGCVLDDERVLRRTFELPASARTLEISSSPDPGWFGREGLTIAAVFRLDGDDLKAYRDRASASGQWRELPILQRSLAGLPAPEISIEQGWYRCLAAGDDIMRAEKAACETLEGRRNDYMIAVLEPESGRLEAFVRTGY